MLDEAEINRIMQGVIDKFLIPRFNELGYKGGSMNATGEWLESLETEVRNGLGVIRGRDYSELLAKGRKPNQDQDPNAMRKWAYGMANYNPEFMAWLNVRGLQDYGIQIAYKIAENGTTYYQDGGTTLLEVLESPEVIKYIESELKYMFTAFVKNHFQREIKKIFA